MVQIKKLVSSPSAISAMVLLHLRCLPHTLNSQRGSETLVGIYRHLVHEGHSIYAVTKNKTIVAGAVVLVHHKKQSTVFALTHRPWSWLSALRSLGVTAFSGQLIDLLAVRCAKMRLPAHNYIVAVYVDPVHRRTGIARQLIRHVMDDAKDHEVALAVDTMKSNPSAQQFYRVLGFTEQRRTKRSVIFAVGVA